MKSVFILLAYFMHEGTQPICAFATEEEAQALADAGNRYPPQPRDPAKREVWEKAHPIGSHTYCDAYEVEEVPFGPPQRSDS